jgi:spermidine/putrescine transport system permease protein
MATEVAAEGGVGRKGKWAIPYLLMAPGLLWLIVFFIVPLVTLGRTSLRDGTDSYSTALSDFQAQFFRSLRYAGTATIISLVIGYPLAYVIAFRAGRWKNLLLALVVLPFFTTYLLRTIAWKFILTDQGWVVQTMRNVGLLSSNGRLLSTSWAVVGGLTYNFLPFMVLPIYVSLEKIDVRLVEAGRDLYASAGRTFRKVVLPLSLPGLFAGSLLTFIPAAGDFVNAQLLGGPNQKMIGNSIESQFLVLRDYPIAAAISFALMALILAGVLLYARLLGTEDLV